MRRRSRDLSWERKGTLGQRPPGRYGHSSVLYEPTMHMIVFAGFTTTTGTLNDVYFFSFGTGTWVRPSCDGVSPLARFYHSAVLHGMHMYIYGGHSGHGGTYFSDVHVLNVESCHWSAMVCTGDVPVGRRSHAAVVYTRPGGGAPRMFVFGGQTPDCLYCDDLLQLELSTSTWTKLSPSGSVPPAKSHSLNVYQDSLYLFGGRKHEWDNVIYKYDIERNSWSHFAVSGGPPLPRYGHTCVVHAEEMFVFGGITDPAVGDGDVWRVSLHDTAIRGETRKWMNVPFKGDIATEATVSSLSFHSAVVHGHSMYIFGGYTKSKNNNHNVLAFSFDPIPIPPSSRQQDFASMLGDAEFCDVTFVFDHGDPIYSHRAILAARSAMFRAMFRSHMKEQVSGKVNLGPASRALFHALLTYVYTDTVELDAEDGSYTAMDLLAAAEQYGLPRLKRVCMERLRHAITPETVADVAVHAEMHGARELLDLCIAHIGENIVEVYENGTVEQLKAHPDVLYEVMQSIAEKRGHQLELSIIR